MRAQSSTGLTSIHAAIHAAQCISLGCTTTLAAKSSAPTCCRRVAACHQPRRAPRTLAAERPRPQDIIATLEADGNAYRTKTLYYQLKANDALLKAHHAILR